MSSETAMRGLSAPYSKSVTFRLPRSSAVPAAAETCVEHLFFAPVRGDTCAVYGTYAIFILYSFADERGGLVCAQTAVRQMFTVPLPGALPGAMPSQAFFEPQAALRPGTLRGTWTVDISAEAQLMFGGARMGAAFAPGLTEEEETADTAEVRLPPPRPQSVPEDGERPALPAEPPVRPAKDTSHQVWEKPVEPRVEEQAPVHCWRVRGGNVSPDLLLEMPDAQRRDYVEEMG